MDNLEGKQGETPEMDNSQTAEELKAERHAQQEAWSKQEVDRLRGIAIDSAVTAGKYNAQSLLDLHEKDPKLAEEAAKRFSDDDWNLYNSFDALKSDVFKEEEAKASPQWDFDKMYEERRAKEVHQESLQKANDLLSKLDDGLAEEAKKYFDKLSDGRTLDIQSALEYADMATLYVSKDKIREGRFSDWLTQLSSTNVGTSKKSTKSESKMILNGNGELVLDSNKQK